MQSVSSRIWTRVAVFISYDNDDNHYTTGTSINQMVLVIANTNNSIQYQSFFAPNEVITRIDI